MIVRDSKKEDYPEIVEVLNKFAYKYSVEGITKMGVARTFTLCREYGFHKVVEDKGKVIGFMGAFVSDDPRGYKIASDVGVIATRGTASLLRAYKKWATEQGADFIQIGNQYGGIRYDILIRSLGFKDAGRMFVSQL